jgi:para-aminobenzoate synthetase component 1
MREFFAIEVNNNELFEQQLLVVTDREEMALVLNSHWEQWPAGPQYYHNLDFLAGFGSLSVIEGSFSSLRNQSLEINDWLLGFLAYDLKNEIEELTSHNFDGIGIPNLCFFQPRYMIIRRGGEWKLGYSSDADTRESALRWLEGVMGSKGESYLNRQNKLKLEMRESRESYLQKVEGIKQHIARGDIYEMNFCIEFFSEQAIIDPVRTYKELSRLSPTPFSAYLKKGSTYLLSASPERYLCRQGELLISQPIKGTSPRKANLTDDEQSKNHLQNDPKERAENIMITDLVRNDLSRVAKRGSVQVEELCGVYPFRQVYQMISTITAHLDNSYDWLAAIERSFPMGSMTGAPKVSAMKLIEEFESTKRGLYSGAVGYVTPERDFDFNVVIRSILYDAESHYLSFMAGSAITHLSVAEKEYEECLLKASAMKQILTQNNV